MSIRGVPANRKQKPLVLVLALFLLFVPLGGSTAQAQSEKDWLYQQINALRSSLGLHGYARNAALDAAAQAHSEWMAATGIIAHDQDDGSGPPERAAAYGYTGRQVSEDIYGGTNATAQAAWNWWINSPIHYAGITHADKNEVGIGIATADGVTYYTLVFGIGSGVNAPPPIEQSAPVEQVPPPIQDQPAPAQPQAALPTQPPRPLITFTPSPTIPSQTPTQTWTPTFTWTPSPVPTSLPPTNTPLLLPTAIPLAAQTATQIALLPTSTPLVVALSPKAPPPADPSAEENEGFNWRKLLPILIVVQVAGMGWVVWRLAKK